LLDAHFDGWGLRLANGTPAFRVTP